jgi:hypothetical protein
MPEWAKHALLGTTLFLTCWTLSYAGSPEPVSIQKVVAEGSSIQRRQVTLQGVVHDLQVLASPSRNCLLTHGQATFNLDDGTGILPVEVISRCGRQPSPLPNNGDEVHLTVIIHVLNTDLPLRLLAQATSHITILEPK